MKNGQFWRSAGEYAGSKDFRRWDHAEFLEEAPAELDSPSRRQFLKVMGASMALAGMTACHWPEEEIVPVNGRPKGRAPGEPVHYMTAMQLGGSAIGLMVTSYDGRPIKIEGNPNHPINRGATNMYAQAAILDLYDPDRSKHVIRRDKTGRAISQTWNDFLAYAQPLFEKHRQDGGKGLRVLSGAVNGPSMREMQKRFKEVFPQAAWHEYEAVSCDNEREGTRTVFGQPQRVLPNLANADVIVSLDADFLHFHPAALKNAREFAERRQAKNGKLNRLYMIEPMWSITGAMADHRVAVRDGEIGLWAMALANACGLEGMDERVLQHVANVQSPMLQQAANDLLANKGRCLVMAGHAQDAGVHALAHRLNMLLGAAGTTVQYAPDANPERRQVQETEALDAALQAGAVETLLVLDSNIAYLRPDLLQGLRKVPNSVHLGLHEDETAAASQWHLPMAHFLESWGDAEAADGTVSIVQPLIAPLYDGRSAMEIIALAVGDTAKPYDIVRRTFMLDYTGIDPEAEWKKALRDGVKSSSFASPFGSAPAPAGDSKVFAASTDLMIQQWASMKELTVEIITRPSYNLYDGRFANNGWMHEIPDPITKMVWDNVGVVSLETASKNGWKMGDVVSIPIPRPIASYQNSEPVLEGEQQFLEVPIHVMPGVADGSVVLTVGYGRRAAGRVGDNVGYDANKLLHVVGANVLNTIFPAEIKRTGKTHKLASTQDYHAIDMRDQRKIGSREMIRRLPDLLRETTPAQMAHPEATDHAAPEGHEQNPKHSISSDQAHGAPQLWDPHDYEGYRWGMTIDLTRCIGCNACVAACYAENNIPVVGKDETARGRDMAWLRVDRYFRGAPEDPLGLRMAFQPVACHHCETAPCEQVCPVGATVHDSEGLNAMVYNRCVGTRYCSNNCPYKVRRFNYFNNVKRLEEVEKMKFNPDVTVRSRGVMEKCTYCVQRIIRSRIDAKNERRALEDGEVRTACQQVCPTQAIVFGDLNNPDSEVGRLQKDARAYAMLGELNTRPRTMYLARIRQDEEEA